MGIPCNYCKLILTRESAAGSQFLRHIKLFHSGPWTDFERAPHIHPLVCGVCKWRCTTNARDYSKHINHHTNGTNPVKVPIYHRIDSNPTEVVLNLNDINEPYGNDELTQLDTPVGVTDEELSDLDIDDDGEIDSEASQILDSDILDQDDDVDELNEILPEAKTAETAVERYVMELYTNGTITTKTIQTSVSATQSIVETTVGELHSEFDELVEMLPKDLTPTIYAKIQSLNKSYDIKKKLFRGLETEHQRRGYLQERGAVMPKSFVIGHIPSTKADGGRILTPATAEYVPIVDTLMLYNRRKPVVPVPSRGVLQSFRDTKAFRENEYYSDNPTALQLTLYHDDIEVGNPLGSRAGIHKLTMFYIAVDGFYDGKLNNIHLALICHASDLSRFGYKPILKPLIEDLEMLALGVKVQARDGNEYIVQARLEHISADNLAANQIMGFNRSFSKGHYCRFCYANADICSQMVCQDSTLLRSATNHRLDVEFVEADTSFSKRTGVRERSALDDISYYSLLDSTVPDVMHDFLEGIGPKEIRLVLQQLVSEKHITLAELNDRIMTFDYGEHEKKNRPSLQISLDSMKQTATQLWCLIRFLPQLIGHKVPKGHSAWQVFLSLRQIMDLVFSPVITEAATRTLGGLIEEHHSLFLEVFPDERFSAKAHWVLHYPDLIRQHGPLIHYWCMRFEGKHKLAKSVTSVSCNRMNVPLTVATRYQLKDNADRAKPSTVVSDIKVGSVIVVGVSPEYGEPVFGRVRECHKSDNVINYSCQLYESHFDSHYHAFCLDFLSTAVLVVSSDRLHYKLPVSHVRTKLNTQQFCLRHHVM